MDRTVLTTIALTGFAVAFLHAAIPTHWLPFVLTARVQRWTRGRTLGVTALAGTGHTLFTALLGMLLAFFGIALSERIGNIFVWIAGGALMVIGLYYLIRARNGHAHGHWFSGHQHEHHDHAHDHSLALPAPKSDWGATLGLLALLTFSPCEGFLPVYVSGIRFGWSGFLLLTLILSVATVTGMILFTWLTLTGIERWRLSILERYEGTIMGALLFLLGALIILFEH